MATVPRPRRQRGQLDDAIALAGRAEAIAASLRAFDALSNALNTRACAISKIAGDWLTP